MERLDESAHSMPRRRPRIPPRGRPHRLGAPNGQPLIRLARDNHPDGYHVLAGLTSSSAPPQCLLP